jgi:hypothetical protein
MKDMMLHPDYQLYERKGKPFEKDGDSFEIAARKILLEIEKFTLT